MMNPFTLTYTPAIPELLRKLNCSLVVSTYQAGKVIFLSAQDDERLIQLPRTFPKAMGVAIEGDRMAVASTDEVVVFKGSAELAKTYPKNPGVYDMLYMPRARYITGSLDIHDLEFGKGGLYAVNTLFSCIVKIDDQYSFTPYWKPDFISEFQAEDRCHLNGMAMYNGLPAYTTSFNRGNSFQSWKTSIPQEGVVMDIQQNTIICCDVKMPHSPKIFNDKLYVLSSADSGLYCIDRENGKAELIKKLGGFVRGMDLCGDFLFIGLSKLRKNSSSFGKLPIADSAHQAGILILHLPTAAIVGHIIYQSTVDEVYDIKVLSGITRPNILNTEKDEHKMGLHTPFATYWAANTKIEQQSTE